jgi:hypothetical protein
VLVPLASPESPPPASSDHRRSSPTPSLSDQGTRPVSDRERARETERGPLVVEWAALLDWAVLLQLAGRAGGSAGLVVPFCFWKIWFLYYFTYFLATW